MIERNLDGCYFRVERDNEWKSLCFSDLTEEEMKKVLVDKGAPFLASLCCHLGIVIQDIGNDFNIVYEDD